MSLDPQAIQLNDTIGNANQSVSKLLSPRGKSIYFPKLGILSQAAAAKGKKINATIGIALEENGQPMALDSITELSPLDRKQLFPYAPSQGNPDLRKIWKEKMAEKNPGLKDAPISMPVVTNALTHGIGIAGYMFCGEGDEILVPDFYWENYDLTLELAYGCSLKTFNTFNEQGGFDIAALEKALNAGSIGKKVLLLNFPNNPTGYTPTNEEAAKISEVVLAAAQKGNQIAVIIDDAYFGLVFEEGIYTQSIFAELAQLHENVLAIKIDGATKEDYVWGFRVGFITYGIKNGSAELYQALEAKTSGAIRGTISNSPAPSQAMLLKAYQSASYQKEKEEKYQVLQNRYNKIKSILSAHPEYAEEFSPLPFNSGYFMCVQMKKDAEAIRQKLLAEYDTGLIAMGEVIRVAFSSTPSDKLEELFANLYSASKAL